MRAAGHWFAIALWLAACSTPKFETENSESDASAGSGGVAAAGGSGGAVGGAGSGGMAGSQLEAGLGGSGGLLDSGPGGSGGSALSSGLDSGADANCTLGLHVTTPWLSPTVTDNAGSGGPWNVPANAQVQDNNDTWAAVAPNSMTTKRLRARGFDLKIPDGSVIDGVAAKFRREAQGFSVRDFSVHLLKGGVTTGDNKANTSKNWDNVYLSKTYGGTNDLWGETWSVKDVNVTSFGVAIAAQCGVNCTSDQARIDHVQVQVTYRPCK